MSNGTLDFETKVSLIKKLDKSHYDMSPYNPHNYLVSAGFKTNDEETEYVCFRHDTEQPTPDAHARLQEWLNTIDLLICHNAKYELVWLASCGFVYEGKVFCTQIAQYVINRGIKAPLTLKFILEDRKLQAKKTDLVAEYMDAGVTFNAIPWEIVEEYGIGDVDSTYALYKDLMLDLSGKDAIVLPTIRMMCEFVKVAAGMELAGAAIDFEALDKVETQYRGEYNAIDTRLHELAAAVMGDTPIRLGSPEFKSRLLFSRAVNDKATWRKYFNIYTDKATGKPMRRNRVSKSQLAGAISKFTTVDKRTVAERCGTCKGQGFIEKFRVDGTPYKKHPKCAVCAGEGIVYTGTGVTAGFKIRARTVNDLAAHGFSTDKILLGELLDGKLSADAREFITLTIRHNAISSYLATFIGGIRRYCQENGRLHTSLNQTITATGRLSSSSPNLHNQPRGGTFPVRRAFISRFKGGIIVEADYEQLEFRAAGILSSDSVILSDVVGGMDVHAYTRDTINAHATTLHPIDRQDAKPDTFKPLYGGMSGSDAQVEYYKAFLAKYFQTAEYQTTLKTEAVTHKRITLPTGRQYKFPYAKRLGNGYVQDSTKIVNYPVQGFATADLALLGIIAVDREFKKRGLRSILFLTVHDSVEADCYPGELDQVVECFYTGLLALPEMLKEFYNLELNWQMPMGVEIKKGPNWLDTEVVGVWTRVGSNPIMKVEKE